MSRFLNELSVTPMADGQTWRLNEDFSYTSHLLLVRQGPNVITVPRRFVTDFASVPRFLQGILPAWNRWGPAAIVHDYLYTVQTTTRDVADGILREAMLVLGVDQTVADMFHSGVRLGGQGAWDSNTELALAGYRRQASLASLPPYASPV